MLQKVVDRNIKINVGSQGTIKPDGVGFHHHTAYIAGYSPFTFEAFAQLLYLLSGSDLYNQENVDAVKFALDTYRLMAQKYDVSASLKGRLISSDPEEASIAITKAMALMALLCRLGLKSFLHLISSIRGSDSVTIIKGSVVLRCVVWVFLDSITMC